MGKLRNVYPINVLSGMSVVSLDSGNRLGRIADLYIDPINGVLLGITVIMPDGTIGGLSQAEIYSFGRDAVMVQATRSITAWDDSILEGGREASRLIGTKIITESGDVLGQITNVFVTMRPPPQILYEARHSIIDKLLGRELFLPASVGHALSDDATTLIVPDATTEIAVADIAEIVDRGIEVRSYNPLAERSNEDDTVIVRHDEEETVVRLRNEEDDTVLRLPRTQD